MIVGRKKWLTAFLTAVFILSSSMAVYVIPVLAASENIPQLYWENTNAIIVSLTIDDGRAFLDASVTGYNGVTEITAEAVLERKNSNGTYSLVERWDDLSASGKYFNWSSTRYVDKGYTYRFTLNATVYKDGVGEEVSESKSAS